MTELVFDLPEERFAGRVLDGEAPETTAALRELLPLETRLGHVRWSGYATWVSLGDAVDLTHLPRENHTVYPSRGDVLVYPGYRNEPEILLACGPTCFKSPAGELAGNHVATVAASRERLASLEESTLEDGAMDVTVRLE